MSFLKVQQKRHSKRTVRDVLSSTGVSPLDAEVLLAHVLGKDRSWLLAHGEYQLSLSQQNGFDRLIERRRSHVPVAYLTGHKEFYGLDLLVTPAVLIPRPETETLVEIVLSYLDAPCQTPARGLVIDVGSGSGAIALAIASRTDERLKIIALDESKSALSLAHKNAFRLGFTDRITFLKSNLLSTFSIPYTLYPIPFRQPADPIPCIIANLPYLSDNDYVGAVADCPEIAIEPRSALVAGSKGTELIEALLAQTSSLFPAAPVFLEIGAMQGESIQKTAAAFYPTAHIEIKKDLAAFDRYAVILPQIILTADSSS